MSYDVGSRGRELCNSKPKREFPYVQHAILTNDLLNDSAGFLVRGSGFE
jgi:hypothetical protein